jgi:ubiquinone/menaquinone biosynthesis C-methylase UbiE
MPVSAVPPVDPILDEVRRFYEAHHEAIERSRRARRYFYDTMTRVIQARIPAGQRVLDVGCGSGDLLAALQPSYGVGIGVAPSVVAEARHRHALPHLRFLEGGTDPPSPRGRRRPSCRRPVQQP